MLMVDEKPKFCLNTILKIYSKGDYFLQAECLIYPLPGPIPPGDVKFDITNAYIKLMDDGRFDSQVNSAVEATVQCKIR